MKNMIVILLFAFISISSAQNKSYAFPIVSLATFYSGVPTFGAGHFFRQDYSTGSIFATTEAMSFYFANQIISGWKLTNYIK